MGESVFPLNDKDRERAVDEMREEIADYLPHPPGDRAVEGCAERCLAALESAGYVILPPGHATIEDRGRWSSRDVLHRRVVGSWQPAENP